MGGFRNLTASAKGGGGLTFYLGTHVPSWLADPRFSRVRLFVSVRALRRSHPKTPAVAPYAVDSGGFQELNLFGRWTVGPRHYLDELLYLWDRLGPFDWAAQQDWMCEPFVLAKTGKTVREHQLRTVDNFAALRSAEPHLPVVPVVQGWHPDDYLAHVGMFRAAGFDPSREPLVGVGSVCRRQGTAEAAEIVGAVAGCGIRVHGFGFKTQGFRLCRHVLASADSLAWSFAARRKPPLPGCSHGRTGRGNCVNCPRYALRWAAGVNSYLLDHYALDVGNPADRAHVGNPSEILRGIP